MVLGAREGALRPVLTKVCHLVCSAASVKTDPSKWPRLTGGLLLTPVHCGALLTTHLRPTPKPIPPSTAVTPQASSGGVTILYVCSTGLKHFHAFLVALFHT